MNNKDVYAKITTRLIAAMEGGTAPWVAKEYHLGISCNALTRRPYSGINVFSTMLSAWVHEYATPGWLTFNQAKDSGLIVRRGEHGTPILFMQQVHPRQRDEQDEPRKPYFMAKAYTVFNLDQLTGAPDVFQGLRNAVMPTFAHDPIAACDAMVAKLGAVIKHTAMSVPSYSPLLDKIEMPPRSSFTSQAAYYGTLFHELAHWTGHVSRLNRNLLARFGDASYAAEELVAELTAAYLCHHFNMDVISRSATYLQSWLKVIKADPTILVASASAACAAADRLLGRTVKTEEIAA